LQLPRDSSPLAKKLDPARGREYSDILAAVTLDRTIHSQQGEGNVTVKRLVILELWDEYGNAQHYASTVPKSFRFYLGSELNGCKIKAIFLLIWVFLPS
jgi:hypothetical protein